VAQILSDFTELPGLDIFSVMRLAVIDWTRRDIGGRPPAVYTSTHWVPAGSSASQRTGLEAVTMPDYRDLRCFI
jgi:hypothetical protein